MNRSNFGLRAMLGALALSIAAPAVATPRSAQAAPAIDSAPRSSATNVGPATRRVASIPKKMRLTMALTYKVTTDLSENWAGPIGNNTEDEIYYMLSGSAAVNGVSKAFIAGEVRPPGARDIWEMGPNSNKTLVRTLFEGDLSALDTAVLTVAIAEQDNAQLNSFKEILGDLIQYAGDAIEKELGTEGTYDAFKGSTKEKMIQDAVGLLKTLGDRKDQTIGVAVLTAKGTHLTAKTDAGMYSTIASASDKEVKVKMTVFNGSYVAHFRLVAADSEPRPSSALFLSNERDSCNAPQKLLVDSKQGKISVAPGQSWTDIHVKNRRFDWWCDGDLEHTTAPDPTNLVQARRASSGGAIDWKCFYESTPGPDRSF
ncbi:MAG: hypothetical protein IPN32_02075 [Deltaproteobacteria bacterium]|nr:hypothetical protein [Deltaproteobacteria bacterium]